MARAVVFGMGVTGGSVAGALTRRGWDVVAADDRDDEPTRARAAAAGVELIVAPRGAELAHIVTGADVLCPAPGLPLHHPVFDAARAAGVPAWSEFELVSQWGHPPLVAVTGTNGKTTVCELVTAMLASAGRRVVAAGNNDLPLVDAIDQPLDVIVVEASSFRLDLTESFRPIVATWLNVTEDHLDWHGSFDAYVAAKAKIWARQGDDDVAIANLDDAVVMGEARHAPARRKTFSIQAAADGALIGDDLVVDGEKVIARRAMARSWPHDVSNALAASMSAMAAGADVANCARVLTEFRGLPHRVELIGDANGVRFYDDSKATTPASVLTAVSGFDSVVLIAGGRNKGLDLGVLANAASRIKAVVAIGEAADEVTAAFAGQSLSVTTASSMDEAVAVARSRASAGDAVLLSPGCASWDWYRNYRERGDDFARAVHALLEAG